MKMKIDTVVSVLFNSKGDVTHFDFSRSSSGVTSPWIALIWIHIMICCHYHHSESTFFEERRLVIKAPAL
jgi:hypothetical protein